MVGKTHGFSSVSKPCSWGGWPGIAVVDFTGMFIVRIVRGQQYTHVDACLCICIIKDSIKCTKHTFMWIREVCIRSTNNSLHTFKNTFNKQIYCNNVRTGPVFCLALSLSVGLWTCGLTSLSPRSSPAEIQVSFLAFESAFLHLHDRGDKGQGTLKLKLF